MCNLQHLKKLYHASYSVQVSQVSGRVVFHEGLMLAVFTAVLEQKGMKAFSQTGLPLTRAIECWHTSTANTLLVQGARKCMTLFLATASSIKCWLSGEYLPLYWVLVYKKLQHLGPCEASISEIVDTLLNCFSLTSSAAA